MKEVTLSTGQVAQIRSKDELTEGQSRKIEIARSRGSAVFQRLGVETETGFTIPPSEMDKLSDEDYAHIHGFTDALISELTVSFDGGTLVSASDLLKPVYDALEEVVSKEYAGQSVAEGPDEKINPLVVAAGSIDSSMETQI